ncbi:STAS domain-containing protein [Pseudonocardia adelaidensis]|uniref:STAS domain-containing protein n=1 Tax=Pseudonocardia adelaidensis TaxID=648754 RepID=A0ABP9NG13_9PSEU
MLTLDVQYLPDGATTIAAVGEVDAATAARLSAAVHRQLERGPSLIELDLHDVTFLGVAGLQVLLCAADRATVSGVPLRLVYRDPSPAQFALEAAGMVSASRPEGVGPDFEVERSEELRPERTDRVEHRIRPTLPGVR